MRKKECASEYEYDVKYMRSYRRHKDIFVYAEADDEILGVLTKSVILRHGKIRFE